MGPRSYTPVSVSVCVCVRVSTTPACTRDISSVALFYALLEVRVRARVTSLINTCDTTPDCVRLWHLLFRAGRAHDDNEFGVGRGNERSSPSAPT